MSLRAALWKLHRWIGLACALPFAVLAVTGTGLLVSHALGAGAAPQAERLAGVHERRLQPPLVPARALLQPRRHLDRRLLVGGRGDHRGGVAAPGDARREVGVLGDVPGVPAADLEEDGLAEVRPYVGNAPSARGGRAPLTAA